MAAVIDLMETGGGALWAIAALSFVGWYIMLDRWLEQQHARLNTRRWARIVEPRLAAGDVADLPALQREWPCIEASAVAFSLATRQDAPDFGEHLRRFMRGAATRARRRLASIAVIAAVLPLLGLLGTVTGMVQTFTVLADVSHPDPRLLADGITQALLTTEAGLLAALPLLLGHAVLRSSLRRALDRAQLYAHRARHARDHQKAA